MILLPNLGLSYKQYVETVLMYKIKNIYVKV